MRKLIVTGAALTLVLGLTVFTGGLGVGSLPPARRPPPSVLIYVESAPNVVKGFCKADALIDGTIVESHLRAISRGSERIDDVEFTVAVRRGLGLNVSAPTGQVRVVVFGQLMFDGDGRRVWALHDLPALELGARYVLPVNWNDELQAFKLTWWDPDATYRVVADWLPTQRYDGAFDFSTVGGTPEGFFAAVERSCREKRSAPRSGEEPRR
jgi:hypothetical protein